MTKGIDWTPGSNWSKDKRRKIYTGLGQVPLPDTVIGRQIGVDEHFIEMVRWLKEKWKL